MQCIEIENVKLGNMRKAQDWTVTPSKSIADGEVVMQCDKRIARVNIHTGKAMLSDGKGGVYGNTFAFLDPMMGAKEIDVPPDVIAQIKAKIDGRADYAAGNVTLVGR